MHTERMKEIVRRVEDGEVLGPDAVGLDDFDPFGVETLGLVWDSVARDRVAAHLDAEPRHHQPFGVVHGGVWAAIVESLGSVAANLRVASSGRSAVGVNNSTDFLRPHRLGRVDAVATPVHVGRTQQLWLVECSRADDGKLIARGQLRLQHIEQTGRRDGETGAAGGDGG